MVIVVRFLELYERVLTFDNFVSNIEFEGMSPPLILDMFYDIIRKIPFGLEQLTPSIVQCGVYIMDYTAPPSPWKSSGKTINSYVFR